MGMKAIPASNVVVETLGLQGQLTPEKFLADRELILHKTFASASLMPGAPRSVSTCCHSVALKHCVKCYSEQTLPCQLHHLQQHDP